MFKSIRNCSHVYTPEYGITMAPSLWAALSSGDHMAKATDPKAAHHQELKTAHTASLTYTRCSVYSFELLMMGGETARNI
jgi:hypothetical protein